MTAARETVLDMGPDSAAPVVRLVVLGFMGAGKSTVGPMVASALGWDFVDLDDEIARNEGLSASEIIRRRGVSCFRRVESEVGREALRRTRVVVAVGGGWAAEPGHMALLEGVALSVWLRVKPKTALARIKASAASRPLLDVPEPPAAAEALLRHRIAHYRLSDITIDTEGRSPEEVVREILRHPELPEAVKEESA